jgi:hypothetical protein
MVSKGTRTPVGEAAKVAAEAEKGGEETEKVMSPVYPVYVLMHSHSTF